MPCLLPAAPVLVLAQSDLSSVRDPVPELARPLAATTEPRASDADAYNIGFIVGRTLTMIQREIVEWQTASYTERICLR